MTLQASSSYTFGIPSLATPLSRSGRRPLIRAQEVQFAKRSSKMNSTLSFFALWKYQNYNLRAIVLRIFCDTVIGFEAEGEMKLVPTLLGWEVYLSNWNHQISPVEIMRKFSEQYARKSGTYFCVDKGVTSVVIKGLADHKDSLGAPLCPCITDDKAAEAGQGFWNCPCVPMRERKECHCMLFLTPENDFAGQEQAKLGLSAMLMDFRFGKRVAKPNTVDSKSPAHIQDCLSFQFSFCTTYPDLAPPSPSFFLLSVQCDY
ncbi:hypothetical protein L1049_001982 [Liquidambar formosana]|uniref:Ferredoxin-thioredoxin reductase catalytic chain, chloroplastic n=1 Tax=Liquidambar formosana TaxID=63359 RepID=A0AAP0R7X3_LIQFO